MLHVRDADFLSTPDPTRRASDYALQPKRRNFTAEEKARIVAESFESGDSVCSVARRHGLMAAQLFAWRKNARLRGEAPAEKKARFEPFALEIQSASAPSDRPDGQSTPIEIAIGSMIVRVPQGFDAATLKAVLQALQSASNPAEAFGN